MSDYTCPHCKKTIDDEEAVLCLYCGESLGRNAGFMGKLRHPRHTIITVVLIAAVLLGFVLLAVK
ncbi:MAG: hypothetical protein PHT50_05785 [Candidatus Omnitrophica bacterium]|nr:hypothetical protein [Candidatus Omnitrophota bacterium]